MNPSIYVRPDKPRTMEVTRRRDAPKISFKDTPKLVEVDTFTECHVTPSDVAERMVEYLEATTDMVTLEPSVGTGNLVKALLDDGHNPRELLMIERHHELHRLARERFKFEVPSYQQCFLEYVEEWKDQGILGAFPRIIMNPPFKKVKQHMNTALTLLGAGAYDEAILVALVPITYQHDEMEEMEILPNDTFAHAKVNTKIIKFIK